MKIMHLMSTHSFSGAENVACQIINSFKDEKEYDMIYVSEIKENKQNLLDRNVEYYELKKFNYKNIRKAVCQLKPDIIHAHDIKASIYASTFYKKAKIVSHIHANHENMRKVCLKTLVFNFFSKNIDQFIWVSKSALLNYRFKKNINEKSIVLYNMIDAGEIVKKLNLNDDKEKYDIVYLGRITYQKDPERLIEVIKKIQKIKNNIRVAIIGNGDMFEILQRLVKENHLEDNIKLYGFMDNPYNVLKNSSVMLLVSKYEGTPMCALEAMSLSVPIISTPTDGMNELIINGKNGYLSNDNDEIADIIVNLIDNEKKLNELKNNTKKIFDEKNNINNYKKAIIDIYSEGANHE